ncbi:WD repeat-containing protein 49-like isoform X1 [Stylophora pistillata]|uniref:WD repeat-containing protein on Y chromosome n=1 Tax=Stylophora pistillata TaxID=50429 RepID=A0A2B4RUQ0_STYPI|nr:WD repeat-containing protein 49-like isoform X1 [Stylophora pistillata]PFX20038.1 WD repeat-containing protein on Y chromosome [Stylophora pistillata]
MSKSPRGEDSSVVLTNGEQTQEGSNERKNDPKLTTFNAGYKLVNRLTMHDLKAVQDAFMINQSGNERELSLDVDQFCEILSIVLNKGSREEYEDLFNKVDVGKEGYVDWDRFCSHMLLEYYEKDDRMKTTQVPQWRELRNITSPHKEPIIRISPLMNPSRYIVVSKEGVISLWAQNMKPLRTVQVHTDQDEVKQRDLWVTDFIPMQNIYKLALALTSKEIAIYDLSSKSEFNCQFRIQGLEHTPLCMDYWSNPYKTNEAILVYGDVHGQVNALLFSAATMALFDRPSQPAGSKQDVCLNVNIQDVNRGYYKNARFVKHQGHTEWARQVMYSAHLDCFISCATNYKNSLVLGWIEKSKMNMRTTQFKIPQGVNAFDYSERINLIATAGVNHHVCLWNPYVISKPVGVLRGHMQSVISVRFIETRGQLISLSKDKVLRIWDTHLQVCLQRLSGMFPKGPSEVSITMYYDEEHSKLFTAFNQQLTLMVMKPEVKDRIMSHEHPVTAAIYNSKFNQVVSACTGSVITMWMIETGQKVKQFANAHGNSEITTLTQDATETRLFTASADGTVKIWDFNGHCHHILMAGNGDPAEISQVLCLKRIIIVVGWDRTISVFRDNQLNSFYVYPSEWKGRLEHQDDVLSEAFCAPTTLATASYDGEIVLWNLNSEQAFRHLSSHTKRKSTRSSRRARKTLDITSPPQRSVEAETSLTSATSVSSERPPSEQQDDFGYAVTKLIFLNERPMSASSVGANLVSCNASGWVRFWNSHKSLCVGQFLAHENAGFLTMTVDETNTYLVTGDADGVIKVWDISEYCIASVIENDNPPPLLKQFQPHTDTINSIQLFTRSERLLVLTASSDCAVALWDVEGRYIGIFGQEEHWKIEPISIEEREAEQAKQAEQAESDNSDEDELAEEEGKTDDVQLFADEGFDAEFRVSTWEQTILGKAYQEKRIDKRERRQPQVIPDLPYLNWEKTGQAPAGPYASLETSDLQDVGVIHKPDFVAHPEKYFSERSAGKRQSTDTSVPTLPSVTDNLQMRYDERSLFPKYILEMEAKMKATHALGMRASRGARARGDALQARSRGSHEVPQANNKKMTSWKVLLTSKGKDL